MTVKCPHCGAIWECRQVESTIDNRLQVRPLYDWENSRGEHAYSTYDNGHTPVLKDFCYACAFETATEQDLLDFAREHEDDFRDWRLGL
jgi:hypothetical protein